MKRTQYICVVIQFYPCYNLVFYLCRCMVVYHRVYKTKVTIKLYSIREILSHGRYSENYIEVFSSLANCTSVTN